MESERGPCGNGLKQNDDHLVEINVFNVQITRQIITSHRSDRRAASNYKAMRLT